MILPNDIVEAGWNRWLWARLARAERVDQVGGELVEVQGLWDRRLGHLFASGR
jgi:hypothetical protein